MNIALQNRIAEAIFHLDNQKAWEILVEVSKLGETELSREDYLRLSYLRMNSLSDTQLLNIIKESILIAFSIPDFDLKKKIVEYVELLDYVPAQIDFIMKLKNLFEVHEELLGSSQILLNGKAVAPTVSNWVSDFNSTLKSRDRDALSELQYLNTSVNPKKLTPEQRGALKVVLNLYNLLSQYSDFWNSLPSELPDKELFDLNKYIDELFTSEDSEEEISAVSSTEPSFIPQFAQESQPLQQPQPQPPTRTTPQPTPAQRQAVDDITRAPHTPVNYNTGAPGANGPMSASDSAKIRDLINHVPPANKRGVTMDPTNVKIDEEQQRLNADRAKQVADIQRKLAELRSRNNKTQ